MFPDADVAGYWLGIPYAGMAGHRGLTHSLAFAVIMGLLAAMWSSKLKSRALVASGFVFISTLSHPLLDMLTNGGHGVALWFPWSGERFFFPVRPVEVSPLRLARVFGERGLAVLGSELRWVCLPALAAALPFWCWRRVTGQFPIEHPAWRLDE